VTAHSIGLQQSRRPSLRAIPEESPDVYWPHQLPNRRRLRNRWSRTVPDPAGHGAGGWSRGPIPALDTEHGPKRVAGRLGRQSNPAQSPPPRPRPARLSASAVQVVLLAAAPCPSRGPRWALTPGPGGGTSLRPGDGLQRDAVRVDPGGESERGCQLARCEHSVLTQLSPGGYSFYQVE
jgi:hypothetical protein